MALETVSFINDLVAANPPGTDGLSEGDNHIRNIKTALLASLPGLAGRAFRVQAKSGNYTVVLTDNSTLINCTATLTLTLTAVATLGNGFIFYVFNNTRGLVTIAPNASELINGYLDYIVLPGQIITIFSDGAAFHVIDTPEQHPNPLINSRMRYWGEGTATQSVSNGSNINLATGMRLVLGGGGTGQINAFRDTAVPSVLSSNIFPVFSTALIVQTTVTSATHGTYIKWNLEGNNFVQLAQRPFTFSFWVKSSLTGNYNIALTNAGNDRSYAKSFQISAANTWEFKKFLIPASPSAGTWDYSEGTGLVVRLMLAWAGTTVTDDAWTTVDAFASTPNANFAGTLSASFNVAAPMMSLGYSNRLWTPDLPAIDRVNCERYFRKTFDPDVMPDNNLGTAGAYTVLCNGAGNFYLTVPHYGMRSAPTVEVYNPSVTATRTFFASNPTAYTATVIENNMNLSKISAQTVRATASGNFILGHVTLDSRL